MPPTCRRFEVEATKSMFDELIDRHAEAYLVAYPEIKEFCNFEKSGSWSNYYIGMVWTSNHERPSLEQIKIRGSKSISDNKLVELDLSAVQVAEAFFPGRILAFSAVPTIKKQLKVNVILDPIKIAPRPKHDLNEANNVRLLIASGPYMGKDHEDWTLFNGVIEAIREHKANNVVLIGPFVDSENKEIRAQYDKIWRLVIDKLVEGLHDHACQVNLVPSNRDIIPSRFASTPFYPSSQVEFELHLKDGAKPLCNVRSVTDPAQIELDSGSMYLDVTSAEVLFHLNNCTSFVNRNLANSQWEPLFKHLVTHGIYPIYPPPADMAIDYPSLYKHLHLDRLGPNIIVVPTRFATPTVCDVAGRKVVTVPKCSAKKGFVFVELTQRSMNDEELGGSGDCVMDESGDKFSQEFKFISLQQQQQLPSQPEE